MTYTEVINIVQDTLPKSKIETGTITRVFYNDYVIVIDSTVLFIRKSSTYNIVLALAAIYLDNIDKELLTAILKTLV